MDLDNLFKGVIHYLLFGGMTYLGYQDEFPIVSAFMCMSLHWTRPTKIHDINYYVVTTSLSYGVAWVFNLEKILS